MAKVLDELRVILGFETKGFSGGRTAVRSLTEGIQKDFARLTTAVGGFFTIAAGAELNRSVKEMASRWQDIAEETGKTAEEIQRFDAYAKRASGTVEDLAQAWDVLAEKRKDALEKGGDSAKLFRGFGISEQELRNTQNGSDLFNRIASVANDPTNTTQREQFISLFGVKRARKLLNIASSVNEGGEVNVGSNDDIKILDESSKALAVAMTDFKVAAMPLVAAINGFIASAMKFYYGNGGGESERSRVKALRGELLDMQGDSTMTFFKGLPDWLSANAHGGAALAAKGLGLLPDMDWIGDYVNKAFGKEGAPGFAEIAKEQQGKSDAASNRYLARKSANASRSSKIEAALSLLNDPTPANLAEAQRLIAEIKGGRPVSAADIASPSQSVATPGGSAPARAIAGNVPPYSADAEAARLRYQDALDAVLFNSGTQSQKKKTLDEQMTRDMERAKKLRDAGKLDEASKLEADVIKTAGQRAELERWKPFSVQADSMAAVGGFIGGAAAGANPSLQVQQDMRAILANILGRLQSLPPQMQTAITNATRQQPISGVGGVR
jgi:hypothetical protein